MKKYLSIYSYVVLVCFLINIICPAALLATDESAYYDMLMSDDMVRSIFGNQIGTQSESTDLSQQSIAPAPKVITTSSGDLYIVAGDGQTAQVSVNEKGLVETTYTLNGARVMMTNEAGEEFTFEYELDGSVVKLKNAAGVTVRSETYNMGMLTSSSSQGSITYVYSDDGLNRLIKSVDQWNNETIYDDEGRPDYIQYTFADGTTEQVGDYTFNKQGILEKFTDRFGSVTYFELDGIRPSYVTNAQGTITTRYNYVDNKLASVQDVTTGRITQVVDGYYSTIIDVVPQVDAEGNAILDPVTGEQLQEMTVVGSYNYDVAGNVASITSLGEEGLVTGWTDYDEFGRVIGTYNHLGVKTTDYVYNDRGFLEQTFSLGSFDQFTGAQARLSFTNYDKMGRPFEVFQLGDGNNRVRVQQYEYKENGLLDATYSLGILRNTDVNDPNFGQAVLTQDGRFIYYRTSKTTMDSKGRPDAVYAIVNEFDAATGTMVAVTDAQTGEVVLEKQQKYVYNSRGFMDSTVSYGFQGKTTGKTVFDRYSRPTIAYNSNGSETQLYSYDQYGFLNQTVNKGEGGVTTGWTDYDIKGKPIDVYNHVGSLVQQYDYDAYGLLEKSYSMGRSDVTNINPIATESDEQAVTGLWQDSYNVDIWASGVNTSDLNALMGAVWNWESNPELAQKCALKVIQMFSGDENATGAAYFIIGRIAQSEGNEALAASAYKVQVTNYSGAWALDESGQQSSISTWSNTQLATLNSGAGVGNPTISGYTVFGGDSKPIATFQVYNDGQGGADVTSLVQQYVYEYESNYMDAEGNQQTEIKKTNFVQETINYGAAGYVTGRTTFDYAGRQKESFNEYDEMTQKFVYSKDGFLASTNSYGKDKALTGTTVFDVYSRPVLSYNMTGSGSKISTELLASLNDGVSQEDIANPQLQPFLKGLTQTFEYGADGFLNVSKTWGEAVEMDVQKLDKLQAIVGRGEVEGLSGVYAVKGDGVYELAYDFDDDGDIDTGDVQIYESAFSGVTGMMSAFGSSSSDANYNATYDLDADGDIDNTDKTAFNKTFSETKKYVPTLTGQTSYDKYLKADGVTNVEGITVSKYVYDSAGFMSESQSFSVQTDGQGNVVMDGENPAQIMTGYTRFDAASRPTDTWSVYDDGSGPQASLVQQFVYEDAEGNASGFMNKTLNFGDNNTYLGYTAFDKYGRQQATYNEAEKKVAGFSYSGQGFLSFTSNYGASNAYLGKTTFNRQGRPEESYNMVGTGKTYKGLTSKFNYNEYGFLASSSSYGEDQTLTGATYFDGYGKALRSENEKGIVVSAFEYNNRGFMTQSKSLSFVEDAAADGAITVTNANGLTQTGYYAVTGYTEFNEYNRPTNSYACYWTTQGEGDGSRVQEYIYADGFLTSTNNYAQNQFTGQTIFDKYGRQDKNYNEFNEKTTQYRYSNQGFLAEAYNYGESNAYLGKTVFNAYNRPTESQNQAKVKVQEFIFSDFSGSLIESVSLGEAIDPGTGNQIELGRTTYDAFGKSIAQTNPEGVKVADYDYDAHGFMLRANNYGYDETTNTSIRTGFTNYDYASRATSSWQFDETGGEPVKIQDFVYNTNTTDTASDIQYVGDINTGFLKSTISYGDQETFIGYTTYNRYSQQEKSFNEYDEMTTQYRYTKGGFLSATYSYGINKTYTGKTVFSEYQRPIESYNERNKKTQEFNYNSYGFLSTSVSLGDPGEGEEGPVTATTYYNAWGKQQYTTNAEGYVVSRYAYNDNGFMTRTNNIAVDDSGAEVVTGYTTYNAATRPVESFNVYYGQESVSQRFVYQKEDGTATGFITSANMYTPSLTDGSEVFAGHTDYDRYGRASISYNELGYKTSTNKYNSNGFIDYTSNHGENGAITGYITYNNLGRPTEAQNHRRSKTTEYVYNDRGFMEQTISYNNGVKTSYTNYDIYSKGTETYQLFEGTQSGNGWQYSSGGTANYTQNADGTISTNVVDGEHVGLYARNHYTSYGAIEYSESIGRQGSVVSKTYFDSLGRQTEVWNTATNPAKVSAYEYSSQGFLSFSTSYATMRSFNDNGDPVGDGDWDSSETTRTYFNQYGSQTTEYLLKADGTLGAKTRTYFYNAAGFLEKSMIYQDNKYQGYLKFDASGRQIEQFNAEGTLAGRYFYDANGFLTRSTQEG